MSRDPIEILEDDELEQANEAMGKSLFDQAAAILQGIDAEESANANGWWETSEGAKFGAEKLRELRALLEARAGQPVGVPDGLFLGDALLMWNRRHDNPPIKVGYEYGVADAFLQIMGAPTVKAEQVQCRTCNDTAMIGDLPIECPDCCHDEAPSLPAAGSTDLTASQCACGDEYPANSYGAGFMAANNGICENCDAANSCASEPMPAAGSAVESWSDQLQREFPNSEPEYWPDSITIPAMGREIRELRAALSAQQSAPERVSVPVEVAIALLDDGKRAETWRAQDELRALLASHGRGGA